MSVVTSFDVDATDTHHFPRKWDGTERRVIYADWPLDGQAPGADGHYLRLQADHNPFSKALDLEARIIELDDNGRVERHRLSIGHNDTSRRINFVRVARYSKKALLAFWNEHASAAATLDALNDLAAAHRATIAQS